MPWFLGGITNKSMDPHRWIIKLTQFIWSKGYLDKRSTGKSTRWVVPITLSQTSRDPFLKHLHNLCGELSLLWFTPNAVHRFDALEISSRSLSWLKSDWLVIQELNVPPGIIPRYRPEIQMLQHQPRIPTINPLYLHPSITIIKIVEPIKVYYFD